MQTFLPYYDMHATARILDYRRLNKQIVECKQILDNIFQVNVGWANHPVVKMWSEKPEGLVYYAMIMYYDWRGRGYCSHIDTIRYIVSLADKYIGTKENWLNPHNADMSYLVSNKYLPSWYLWADIENSHRSNLIRKFDIDMLRRRVALYLNRYSLGGYRDVSKFISGYGYDPKNLTSKECREIDANIAEYIGPETLLINKLRDIWPNIPDDLPYVWPLGDYNDAYRTV